MQPHHWTVIGQISVALVGATGMIVVAAFNNLSWADGGFFPKKSLCKAVSIEQVANVEQAINKIKSTIGKQQSLSKENHLQIDAAYGAADEAIRQVKIAC